MSSAYISSAGWTAVAQWAANTVYAVGSYVRQLATPTVGNERVFKATSTSGTGTSGASEPSWSLNDGATTTDNAGANQIVWTEVAGRPAEQVSGTWHAPAYNVDAMPSGLLSGAADTIYLSSDHNVQRANAVVVNFGSNKGTSMSSLICVSRTGSVPPVTADLSTGANIGTTGSNNITLRNYFYAYGLTFQAGSGSSTADILFGIGGDCIKLDTCSLVLNNTGGTSFIGANVFCFTDWLNTTVTFGAVGQSIRMGQFVVNWRDTARATLGTVPTFLFTNQPSSTLGGSITVNGVDLSSINTTLVASPTSTACFNQISITNCKLNSSVTIQQNLSISGSFSYIDGTVNAYDGSDDTSNNRPYRVSRSYTLNLIVQDTTIIKTGGTTWGSQGVSYKLQSTLGSIQQPATFPAIQYLYTGSAGTTKTFTFDLIGYFTSQPTNAQVWVEATVMDSSASPLSSLHSSRVANLLPSTSASNLTNPTTAWDSAATARVNSHTYSTGDLIAVSSNPGRVFICTSGGVAASSLPAAYATATDGTSVTDNSATFRALWRMQVAVSVTPQQVGYIALNLKAAFASSLANSGLWLDPTPTVT